MTSLSTKLNVCKIFLNYEWTADDKYGYTGTLFWIESNSARGIKQFSFFQSEDEFILLPAVTVHTIAKSVDPEYKYLNVVEVKEMTSHAAGKFASIFADFKQRFLLS